MKEVKITDGSYIQYDTTGTVVSFNDGDLMFNLAKYERDFEVSIDVCCNAYGNLSVGVDNKSGSYVAQIVIPPRKYSTTKGEPDENGVPTNIKTPVKLNMDTVTINLWGGIA